MKTTKNIIRYIVGITALLSVFMNFEEHIFSSLFFLFAAFFITPITHNLIFDNFDIEVSQPMKYVVAIGLFMIASTLSISLPESTPEEKNEQQAKEQELYKKEEEEQANELAKKQEEEWAKEQENKYLFESVTDFQDSYNDFSEKTKLRFRIENIEQNKGQTHDSFNCMFTQRISVIGYMNKKNGKITNLTSLGSFDKKTESVLDVMIAFTSLIAVVDKSIKPESRLKIIQDLGFLNDKANFEDISDSTIVNGNTYHLAYIKDMGLMFNISKSNTN